MSSWSALTIVITGTVERMNEFLILVLAGITVAALSVAARNVAPWRPHPFAALHRSWSARTGERERRRARHALETKAKNAQVEGRCIAMSRRGHRPTEVAWSDGCTSWYFNNDLPAYKAALASRRYPIDRTFPGRVPAIGTVASAS
jgi:hypothetical protein